VLEDASEKKLRLHPLWGQSRNWGKLIDESRSADDLRTRGMIVVTGSNKRYRARMVGAIRIRVNAFMQLRRDAQY